MHTEDTLFFVAEGDFRFYAEDCQRELSQFEYEATQQRARTIRRQCLSFKWYAPMDTELPDGAESVTAPSEATGSASAARVMCALEAWIKRRRRRIENQHSE